MTIIWLIFAFLFFYMAWRERKKSGENIKSLETIQPLTIGQVLILGIDFTEVIKKFKNELNNFTQESHRVAAQSYFLAGLTALVSFIISFV